MEVIVNAASSTVEKTLEAINFTVTKILHTARQVKSNGAQSKRLAERVVMVGGVLQTQQISKFLSPPMQTALVSFAQFVERCQQFLEQFTRGSLFGRIRSHANHAQQFQHLNVDLDRYMHDLSFGLQVQMMQRNVAEDVADEQHDLQEAYQIEMQQTGVVANALPPVTGHATGVVAPAVPASHPTLVVPPHATAAGAHSHHPYLTQLAALNTQNQLFYYNYLQQQLQQRRLVHPRQHVNQHRPHARQHGQRPVIK